MSKATGHTRIALSHQTIPQLVLNTLLVSAGYYVLAVVGTTLSAPLPGFVIIWPATALLVSVLILTPARRWWLYLLAVVPAHFHVVYHFPSHDSPLVMLVLQLIGTFSIAIITGIVVRTTSVRRLRFDTFQGLLSFMLLAGLAVPAVVNALMLCLPLWTGGATDFWLSWRQGMLASVFPTITIPPLAVVAMRGSLVGHRPHPRSSYVELGLLSIALSIMCVLLFGWGGLPPEHLPIMLLAPLPFLLWAAVRLGVGATSIALLVVAGAISASAFAGRGPFAPSSPIPDVVSLQVFLIAISVPIVLLAALAEERTHAAASLKSSEHRLLTLQQQGQQRIAEQLHDSTSQHLTAMALNLMVLKSRAGADATEIIDDLRTSLKEATRELRSFGYLLHPVEVQRGGFLSTLHRYVDGFAMRTQLRAKVRAPSLLDELPLPVQEALLRIVQESLANVYRHASASLVTVKLSRVGHRLHLLIADDGQGILCNRQAENGETRSRGMGISGMKARARQCGGRLDVRRRPRGTIVHAAIPIRACSLRIGVQ